jgi:hypothetical protein
MLLRIAICLVVFGCGSKVEPPPRPQPVAPLPEHATEKPPGAPTGTRVQMTCKGQNPDLAHCHGIDYEFDATYDQTDTCRWGGDNALNFKMKSSSTISTKFNLHIENFNGAGTYQITGDSYVELAASVTRPATGSCRAITHTSHPRAPKESCTGCQATVTDADPSAPYPKTLSVSVACPATCIETVYVCKPPINVQFTQTCTR